MSVETCKKAEDISIAGRAFLRAKAKEKEQ